MSQAIVEPGELRQFAQNLRKFNTELQERTAALTSQLQSLATTWRDQEYRKFSEEFEGHVKAISRYIEATERYIPFLIRKAERIEEYLQQR
ncbi:MAG: WXG100 family type VII secretion target [Pirellulales bacterium]|nr:WXG100 family type VII secretion target [Pirellulales bacterium]